MNGLNNKNGMNGLPEECWILIFKKVDLLQQLKLRTVCVTWKQIIEGMRTKHVSVVDSQFNRREKWNTIGLEAVNYQYLLYYSKPSLNQRLVTSLFRTTKLEEPAGSLQLLSKHAMFSRLRSMFLSLPKISNFRFEQYINPFFGQLEELSCLGLNLEQTCLSLPHLKTLSVHGLRINVQPIKLMLPELRQFSTSSSISAFEFAHPETVTHMLLNEDHESIVQFVNLECLSCQTYRHEAVIFPALTKLKRIHYDNVREILTKDFAQIHRTKQNSGRHETKIVILSLDYQDYRLERDKFSFESTLKNYFAGKLITSRPISIIPNIDFNTLSDQLNGQSLPADFWDTFSNIRSITVHRKIERDVKLFFILLDKITNLYDLRLSSAFDGHKDEQRCYVSLPFYSKHVRKLEINSREQEVPLDLHFVLKFNYLQRFKTNLMVRSNVVRQLFEKLKYFEELELTGGTRIKIIKTDTFFVPRFLLKINEENSVTFLNFGRLIAFYQEKIERVEIDGSDH